MHALMNSRALIYIHVCRMKFIRARVVMILVFSIIILFVLAARLFIRPSWPREKPDKDEVRHVFFLKVHKAASTTVMGIMFRFALDRKLDVLIPMHGNALSETRLESWNRLAIPLSKGRNRYDILCNHVVFDGKSVREAMYPDVKLLAIVRYPFAQFLSAFQFFRTDWKYLKTISGPNPIASYFQNPDFYEPPNPRESFTNNRMSVDFGMDPSRLKDRDYVRKYIDYLGNVFDLVLVVELFDESVIAMRRLLQWRLQDVLYIPVNTQKHNNLFQNFTHYHRQIHRKMRFADYELYDYFLKRFQEKLNSFGDTFFEEVRVFRNIRKQVESYCRNDTSRWMDIEATAWNERFRVDHNTCFFFEVPEEEFVDYVKYQQLLRIR